MRSAVTPANGPGYISIDTRVYVNGQWLQVAHSTTVPMLAQYYNNAGWRQAIAKANSAKIGSYLGNQMLCNVDAEMQHAINRYIRERSQEDD